MSQNETNYERWYRCEHCGWSGQHPPRDPQNGGSPYCPDCEQSTDEKRAVVRDDDSDHAGVE